MSRNTDKVKRFLRDKGVSTELVELKESTRTSQMAANVLKCELAQIAKSIVFVNEKAIVVVISGDKKVDEKKLSKVLGHKVSIANAGEVKKFTGYVIGGVPPFPHSDGVKVVLDSSLKRFKEVWTAAGSPNSVFRISVEDLKRTVGSDFTDISK
ncbi:MAG: YbaK/EbsC family protein [Candidatus Bathyarchaeia archaeon]